MTKIENFLVAQASSLCVHRPEACATNNIGYSQVAKPQEKRAVNLSLLTADR